jgi:DNA-directed RNA polymerase
MSNNSDKTVTERIIEEIEEDTIWEADFDRQVELEEKMRGLGVERHWSNISKSRDKNSETGTTTVRRLMNHSVEKIAVGISEFIDAAKSGKAGRKHSAVKLLEGVKAEAAALITARVVLDGIAKGDKLVPLARRIAGLIEDELSFKNFEQADASAFKWLVDREKRVNGTSYRRQRTTMKLNMKRRDIAAVDWTAREQLLVGSKLLEIMVATTGLVEEVTRNVDVKREAIFIEATAETMQWIEEENNRCEALSPMYLPTIIPPRPWTSPYSGGYWTQRVRRLTLIKTYSKAYLEDLAEQDMPQVYDAVNAMQHTAWSINKDVLDIVQELWDNGSSLGGIPSAEDLPAPSKPQFLIDDKPREEWSDEQMSLFKSWKRQATDNYSGNAKLKSLRLQFSKCMYVGELFAPEDQIFFPHQLDFRGRAYAVPMFLNPQGSDLAKALLLFANGVAIEDEEAAGWLAIHGANTFGFDKARLQERVAWVQEREAEIIACAENPFDNRMWSDADKPLQFLAFCIEWSKFVEAGYGYVSTLAVQMDGSCNGLQNYSGMLRDPVGGAAVNLTPSDLPADIYRTVAEKVKLKVQGDLFHAEDKVRLIAKGWLQHDIDRKVCKRPVMTLAYGAKEFGFKTQVFQDTVLPFKYKAKEAFPWEGSGWEAAAYLGKLIWECVAEVVVAARQAMDWFQAAAKVAAKEELPVRWETPDGLVVLQAYPKMITKRIDLTFNGARHYLTLATGASAKLDRAKQANGISPNWIHSMDASHMRATVRRAYLEGIRSFSLIHDSYGTHAGNVPHLARYLREEFIKMYETDVLTKFKTELETQLPEGVLLEPLPATGTLDLNMVLESDYFFA